MTSKIQTFQKAAECLRILAHPDRLRLVDRLIHHPETVSELAVHCEIRQSVASEHLRRMEMCGLLNRRREGRKVYYQPAHDCLIQIIDCIHTKFS